MENRLCTALIGLLFVVLSLAIIYTAENGWWSYLAAIGVGGLGIEAIYSAIRCRRSLISRIGPWP